MIDAFKVLRNLVKNVENFLASLLTDRLAAATVLRGKDVVFDALELNAEELLADMTRQRLAKAPREFSSLAQIEQLRRQDRYKFEGRNMLGVRKFDDWINSLEIGNIMHLNPIAASELLQSVGKHHEFQKDPMLKKLVLLVVSLFSIATEMRMMVQFDNKDKKLKEDLQAASELWHCQSVFFGACYLPANCPLVTHVANSYNKHYISLKQKKPPAESHLKNKGLQHFLLSQPARKSSRTGGSSSNDFNTSDGQEIAAAAEAQRVPASVRPHLTATGARQQRKNFQSESSVSPVRSEGGDATKASRYEKLAKYLKAQEGKKEGVAA